MQDQLDLIKVNVDHHQNLATEYGVRGIPQVTLFHKGKAIGSFTGARTKPQVLDWLKEYLPSKEKDDWKELQQNWSEVPNEKAIPPLKEFTDLYPIHEDARILLARHLAFFNPVEAAECVKGIKMGSAHYDMAQYILQLAGLQDDPYYQSFQQRLLENDLLHAFKQLNDTLLKAGDDEKHSLEKMGVALYSVANNKNKDLIKARKVFDMYTSA